PLYVARRLVRIAAEDVGLADPRALSVALAAKDAYHFLGTPEGELALAEAVIYLATAPKSNRVYAAFGEALRAAREHPAEPVPLHLRNAPTRLMEELGYGAGYKYAHDYAHGYEPTAFGYEREIAKRLAFWRQLRAGGAAGEILLRRVAVRVVVRVLVPRPV